MNTYGEAAYLDAKAGYVGNAAQNTYAPPSPVMTLGERLANLIQMAHGSTAALSSTRERLCGVWPENTNASNLKPVSGQIDGLLDELQAALARISDHAHAISGRV